MLFRSRQDVFVAAAFALLLLLIGRTPARAERLWRAVPMETPAVRWMAFLGAVVASWRGAHRSEAAAAPTASFSPERASSPSRRPSRPVQRLHTRAIASQ